MSKTHLAPYLEIHRFGADLGVPLPKTTKAACGKRVKTENTVAQEDRKPVTCPTCASVQTGHLEYEDWQQKNPGACITEYPRIADLIPA